MDLASAKNVKNLLKNYQIFPLKRFGQNFLVDKTVLLKIIEVACLKPKDIVLEIGPGIGTLTKEIAKIVKKLIAVEKDFKMVEILKETTKSFKNVKIIQADILKIPNSKFLIPNYKVVANLPYYIVSPVIRKFLESENPPKEMILMVQKEVAQRICACPPKLKERRRAKPLRLRQGYGGQAKMNLLSVSVQFYAEPKIISFVSKKSFWPQPKVDSAIIKIVPRRFRVPVSRQFRERFFRIVKAGFSQPRKQLVNNLSKGLAPSLPNGLKLDKEKIKAWLLKNNIQPNQRAETLSLKSWISLTKSFKLKLRT